MFALMSPKNQHTIPRLHLQHFAGREPMGQFWTYDARSTMVSMVSARGRSENLSRLLRRPWLFEQDRRGLVPVVSQTRASTVLGWKRVNPWMARQG